MPNRTSAVLVVEEVTIECCWWKAPTCGWAAEAARATSAGRRQPRLSSDVGDAVKNRATRRVSTIDTGFRFDFRSPWQTYCSGQRFIALVDEINARTEEVSRLLIIRWVCCRFVSSIMFSLLHSLERILYSSTRKTFRSVTISQLLRVHRRSVQVRFSAETSEFPARCLRKIL